MKRFLPVLLDIIILMASVYVAYLLRFEFRIDAQDWPVIVSTSVIYYS